MSEDNQPADAAGTALRHLSSRARRSNLARVAQLEAALHGAADGRLDADGRREAAEVAHQVRGSAGTFGYPRASDLAGRLEHLLRSGDLRDADRFTEALDAVASLRSELTGADRPA